jgi:hypothetical protein
MVFPYTMSGYWRREGGSEGLVLVATEDPSSEATFAQSFTDIFRCRVTRDKLLDTSHK